MTEDRSAAVRSPGLVEVQRALRYKCSCFRAFESVQPEHEHVAPVLQPEPPRLEREQVYGGLPGFSTEGASSPECVLEWPAIQAHARSEPYRSPLSWTDPPSDREFEKPPGFRPDQGAYSLGAVRRAVARTTGRYESTIDPRSWTLLLDPPSG